MTIVLVVCGSVWLPCHVLSTHPTFDDCFKAKIIKQHVEPSVKYECKRRDTL